MNERQTGPEWTGSRPRARGQQRAPGLRGEGPALRRWPRLGCGHSGSEYLTGLGATLAQLRGICRDDPEALDAIDRATQNAPHIHTGDVDNVNVRPGGNASATALRRLRKDRPDLHAEVMAGAKSPHAAMVEAGFRPKTMTVTAPVDMAGIGKRLPESFTERSPPVHPPAAYIADAGHSGD